MVMYVKVCLEDVNHSFVANARGASTQPRLVFGLSEPRHACDRDHACDFDHAQGPGARAGLIVNEGL
ncbi:MAG TPA: hypothetical protein VHG93_06575 [Longimicrobium sp.]|nr:hypothetical protein [Longimicrobium sp.]